SSPLTRRQLVDLGLTQEFVGELARPISALNLQTLAGASCRLEYEHGHACGFDRPRLDAVLLDRSREAGAEVWTGSVVQSIELADRAGTNARLTVSPTDPDSRPASRTISARIVVGADGPRSHVSRAAGLTMGASLLRKSSV